MSNQVTLTLSQDDALLIRDLLALHADKARKLADEVTKALSSAVGKDWTDSVKADYAANGKSNGRMGGML